MKPKIKPIKKPVWKYAKPFKKQTFEEYFNPDLDKKTNIMIKNWNFTQGDVDGESRIIFRTDVISVDKIKTDKILVIKNYDNIKQLKKLLSKKKSIKSTAELDIKKHYNEETFEFCFDIKLLN